MPHGLIYNATWDSGTKTLAFYDRSGNLIYSCVVNTQIVDDPTKPLYLLSKQNGSTIQFWQYSADNDVYQTSTDGITWTNLAKNDTLTLNSGEGVFFRISADKTFYFIESSRQNAPHFVMTGEIEAYNNVNSMLSPNFTTLTDLTTVVNGGDHCLSYIFSKDKQSTDRQDTALTKAPLLPATTLSPYCYRSMFEQCLSLIQAPELPAVALAAGCYRGMLAYTAITTAPALPATTLASECYYYMFNNCTALVQAPELPATTLVGYCYYYMFSGCTGLNEVHIYATDISAVQCLSYWLSNVAATGDFYCAEGVSFPVDSASGIPQGWTIHRSTVESPNLPLCFKAMLDDCSVTLKKNGTITESYEYSLDGTTWNSWAFNTAITLNAGGAVYVRTAADRTTTQTNSNYIWFEMSGDGGIEAYNNTNSLLQKTTFPTLTDLTTAHGDYAFYRLFKGPGDSGRNFINRALTKAPLLPATTLGTACYRNMFLDCRVLATAPDLPATTLVNSCYSYMFGHCDSLSSVRIYATDISATDCLKYWIYNNPATGNFYCVNGVNYPSGESGIPTGWTRIDL